MKKLMLLLILALLPLYGCGAKEAEEEPGGTLTIATLRGSEFLNDAARRYEEAHDGVTVEITAYWNENDTEMDAAKYSQIVNTALMSGKGEDIIDVSSLTWTKIADKNKLVDLNGLLDLDPQKYHLSVLDAFLYNGKRYTLPLCFTFEAFQFYGAAALIETPKDRTIDDLLKLAEDYRDVQMDAGGYGIAYSKMEIAMKLFNLDFNTYVNIQKKEASVDNPRFISMLEKVNNLPAVLMEYPAIAGQSNVYSPAMTQNGVEDLSNMFLLTNEAGQSMLSTIYLMPAISVNSVKKKLAADFIQFLLSDEMMTSPEMYFCPVNKNAVAERARLTYESAAAEGYAPEGFDLEKNIALFNKLTERLGVVANSDMIIYEFTATEIERYLNGDQTAEQAAKNLQSRLTTYLQE
jgi:multiple sugar transport system substrate-binding protein